MTTPMEALKSVSFRAFYDASDIWEDDVISVDGLHTAAFDEVRDTFRRMKAKAPYSNIVIEGRPGVGKSHFLGRVRRGVTAGENLFVYVDLSGTRSFWDTLAVAYIGAFERRAEGDFTQLQFILRGLLKVLQFESEEAAQIVAGQVTNQSLDHLRTNLRRKAPPGEELSSFLNVGVALVLLNSLEFSQQDIGRSILLGLPTYNSDETVNTDLAPVPPRLMVRHVDRIARIADKVSLLAIDQLDSLIALAANWAEADQKALLSGIADGLMSLAQDNSRNTLIVLSCLRESWIKLQTHSVPSFPDRYPTLKNLRMFPSAEVGKALIASHLKAAYGRIGYNPPYPTWPVKAQAFEDAPLYSARELMQLTEKHIRYCRERGTITELSDFGAAQAEKVAETFEVKPDAGLDARFASLRAEADVSGVLDKDHVDNRLPPLLRAGLEAWIQEQAHPRSFSLDAPLGSNAALNARLRQIIDAQLEDEVHWSFRAVPHGHPAAALTRLRSAVTASGLSERRSLFIIRNDSWSSGAKTKEVVAEFEKKGGQTVKLSEHDLKTFQALSKLLAEEADGLAGWLRAVKPASATALLSRIAPQPAAPLPPENTLSSPSNVTVPAARAPEPFPLQPSYESQPDEIPIGRSEETGKPLTLRLEDLRRHIAIFAGSGSGKTVLIRRLVEECALKGVSSIVLDPNNDLARLGTPWPKTPGGWMEGDEKRAAEYHKTVDVAIWTPRLSAGRPIAFAPLADLLAIAGEPDEFEMALDNTVAMLLPRAGLPKTGGKVDQGKAILKEALKDFTLKGGVGLEEFLGYLSSLPDGTSRIAGAKKIAADMANTLIAATINDPLFGGSGTSVDPATLLTPPDGMRARISVISLAGLPTDEQRQGFVGQLQMALFSWVKKNPAGNRPLGGLFVMDEAQTFAPSAGSTPCLASTLALASQARKYGLGLIFATQAPKGLHNQIPGNATTQFFGFLNAPVQIGAAREMALAKGGDVTGIAQLGKGQFFAASDGLAFQKIRSPLCLSHHPASPLTQEEIVQLASTV